MAIYHPRANLAERRNQGIKKGLRLHLHDEDHKKWDLHLPNILCQLRSRRNATGNSVLLKLLLTNPNIKRNTLKSNLRHHMFQPRTYI